MNYPDAKAGKVQALHPDRAIYNFIQAQYGKGVIPTKGYLRSEVVIPTAGFSNLTFPINEGSGTAPRSTERRLKQNDAFMITHIWVGLSKQIVATGAAVSTALLHSFPNDKVFNSNAAETAGARSFWGGYISIRVNDTVFIDSLDMMSFFRADTAQQGVAVSAVATTGIVGSDAWEGTRAFDRQTPTISFNGLGNNLLTYTGPTNETVVITDATPNTNCAVAILRGFNIQNGAQSRAKS